MRVLHVISGDLWAGAETVAFHLLTELARDPGVDVLAVVLNEGKLARSLRGAGVAVEVIDETAVGSLELMRRLLGTTRRFRPGLVHTHRLKENVLGAMAAKLTGASSLRTEHGWTEFPRLGWQLHKRLYRSLDGIAGRRLQQKIVSVSEELAEKLRMRFPTDSVVVIENGVDVAEIRAAARETAPIPFAAGKRAVGIVGRLVPVKRHDRFLAAAERLAQGRPDAFEFHVVGDGPLRGELEAAVRARGLSGRVHFHGFQERVAPLIGALDALVVCSDHEGIPMNVLEAAALGVPVVTTPLPSLAAVLESGAVGVTAEDDTPESIANAIERCSGFARRPPADFSATWLFSHKTMAARYKRLYSELLEHRPERPRG